MIVNDILDFIRFLKEGKKDQDNFDQFYFDEYVAPLWEKYKEIHQNYKKTFKGYSEKILSGVDLESLIVEVKRDSIYSEDLRSELSSMCRHIPQAFPKSKKELLESFLLSLSFYFEAKSYFRIEKNDEIRLLAPTFENGARFRVSMVLRQNDNKKEIETLMTRTMKVLQSNFEWVSDSYYSLKAQFKDKTV